MKAWDKTQVLADIQVRNTFQKPVNFVGDCKQSFGLAPDQDLSDFPVIN